MTESQLMRDVVRASEVLRTIKRLGVEIAIVEELRSLHHPLGQGFLSSRPVPMAAVDAVIGDGGTEMAGKLAEAIRGSARQET